MSDTKQEENLKAIGKCAYESIAEMVAALQCDYDRLEELRDERTDWDVDDNDGKTWEESNADEAEELAELEEAAGDCDSEESARQRIEEDALSLQVRSGWYTPGEDSEPEEFELLLTTGGPAVRIIGDLSGNEPDRPRLQTQDWGTPWTDYLDADQSVLLAYCQCFFYGE